MTGMANENYNVGGTGGNLFSGSNGPTKPSGPNTAVGDDYIPPSGLPQWKQPEYDDDDRVDPDKYPEPSSGPAANLLGRFFPDPVQQGLALSKGFYLFFFSAFGSLFPLMAVYFKQLGMNAAQAGFLIGVRPIIEYLATPFWNKIADRFQKGKIMLMVSVTSWILFTAPIGHIHPPVVSCKYYNGSQYFLKLPNRVKRDVTSMLPKVEGIDQTPKESIQNLHDRVKRSVNDYEFGLGHVIGTSPQTIDFVDKNQETVHHKLWVSPDFNNEVFEKSAVHKVFFLILLLVIIGEFFSSPAIALADSAVITLLGEENQDKYGSQRMFGSIGWGATMFVMGMVLDHSKFFQNARCDMNIGQRNYNVCFSVFSGLMFCALLVASQIPFRYGSSSSNNVPLNDMGVHGKMAASQQAAKEKAKENLKFKEKTKVFAQQLRALPEFAAVFKAFSNIRLVLFMNVAWIMGIGIGLIFTFLFWHLQDLGGSPTLFGIASVINHISEMAAYFYSFKIISKIGHVKVIAAGLLCNVLRFLYVSWITWPWLILPFEFVQGVTHAAVWAACCSFIAHNTEPELRASAQGVLQGIHHGFGRFCGAVFGGMLIQSHGTVKVFRIYGFVCAAILVLFLLVNFYNRNEGGISTDLPDEIDPKQMGGESAHLAPHGVPGAPMPRVLSSTKLDDQGNNGADYNAGQPNLGVPGQANAASNNPFLDDAVMADPSFNYSATGQMMQGDPNQVADPNQYYGRGYTQAQSGYSSSGYGLQ